MRLTPEELAALIKALDEYIERMSAELRLYGSRTDDRKKGGDIDLLLLVHDLDFKKKLVSEKHHILASIKECLGDQKIDLNIALFSELQQDAFLEVIYPDSVLLKKWTKIA
jgi:hypothetical protein